MSSRFFVRADKVLVLGGIMKLSRVFSAVSLVAAIGIGGTAAAWHEEEHRGQVLVLGDSVAFGYIATVDSVGYFYARPENFTSFSDYLGERLHLDVVNASCPGATTGSFLSSTAPDNGCKGYRELYRLHVDYQGTQLEFATTYLKSHRDVRLLTLTLGANDGLLLEISCAEIPNSTPAAVEACIEAGAPAVFAKLAENIGTILADLRATGYGGAIILTNYYSTDYTDSTQPGITELTAALNAAIAAPAAAYGAIVADVFTVFKTLASDPAFGGQTCKTGLLNPDVSSPNLCNEHPALTGHRLIARTIAHALQAADLH
jgi:predicted ribosomally synthesized peptide with SipW-like signal peptide